MRARDTRLVHQCAPAEQVLPTDITGRNRILRGDHPRPSPRHPPILATLYELLDRMCGGVEPPMKGFEGDLGSFGGYAEDLAGFGRVGTEGLFDEDMFAGSHGFDGPFYM
jgi:hypothetical protein